MWVFSLYFPFHSFSLFYVFELRGWDVWVFILFYFISTLFLCFASRLDFYFFFPLFFFVCLKTGDGFFYYFIFSFHPFSLFYVFEFQDWAWGTLGG